ncbi:hypothetical protein COS80_00865 [Candidatus Woesebacteria bacterium CG06_land_8_20_14_3_00_39_27]|uniref:Uncharacterized protein n=1 Tax=Candidatus Woesebacteria bacterium CG06_land_8_20_14_3_00_39_27 TaxID=1975057 RepID=A0A2M7AQG6_9BACT|nr:MAG: hypothetical protein COS80_00865 [Candidatus Woesebacteria bacterium CG06_land_8_20_14_3_00_39_27]
MRLLVKFLIFYLIPNELLDIFIILSRGELLRPPEEKPLSLIPPREWAFGWAFEALFLFFQIL